MKSWTFEALVTPWSSLLWWPPSDLIFNGLRWLVRSEAKLLCWGILHWKLINKSLQALVGVTWRHSWVLPRWCLRIHLPLKLNCKERGCGKICKREKFKWNENLCVPLLHSLPDYKSRTHFPNHNAHSASKVSIVSVCVLFEGRSEAKAWWEMAPC